MMEPYAQKTMALAIANSYDIGVKFREEVKHLLKSGAVDPASHSRDRLFGVALENVADGWLRGERDSKEYKNLKRF